jgi:membrane associated rhomboid family serine protease
MEKRGRLGILVGRLHAAQQEGDEDKEIDCLLKLAEFHYNSSDFVKSRISLNKILEKKTEFPNVNYYLALIATCEKNYDEAIEYIDRELAVNPKNGYARELREKVAIGSNVPVVTFVLLFLNFVVMFFSFPQVSLIDAIKYGFSGFHMNVFNAFTALFLHVNVYHFLFNMVILVMFGLILEKSIGSWKFLFVYLLSGMFGNFCEIYFVGEGIIMGASAALFGVLGALMMREPLLKIKFLGVFDVPIIIVLGGFFLMNFVVNSVFEISFVTGDIAHFMGLIVGIFVIGLFYRDSIEVFYNWVFIALGFWILQYVLNSFMVYGFGLDKLFFVNFFVMVVGLYMIFYSYVKLMRFLRVGGIEDEYD